MSPERTVRLEDLRTDNCPRTGDIRPVGCAEAKTRDLPVHFVVDGRLCDHHTGEPRPG